MVSSRPPAEAMGGAAAWRPPARVAPPALSSPPHLWETAAGADASAAADRPRRWSGARSPRPSRTSRDVDGLRRGAVMAATRVGAPAPPPPVAAYPDVTVCMDDVADDVSVEDLYEPPAVWRDDGVCEDKPAARKVSMDEVQEEKAAAALDAKRQKELKKAIKDYMKTSLSSERTFFKWVWTGLNLGALGMFSLAFFKDHTAFPFRLLLTAAAWAAGLVCALYGLRQFHRRRRALLTANDDPTAWESPSAPAVVVAVFASMIGLMVLYAVVSHQTFNTDATVTVGGGR